ncbi:CoA-binding protein [Ferruginibacter lapsinanis]|uniref:CoA-binding protein n=1 Tax=Ferruginibacter lapsinanis TaxID=563172 RepID=UPI001E5C36F8|nr:CoA-binding protein [Ferruginibacter lapsinanis]UEG50330.1 CoA-binding protein [Ferruginibacter lapsinanis]
MIKKKTLVIGASVNPERYSNLAIRKLVANQHPVVALGSKAGMVDNVAIETEKKPFEDIDTVTLYINPTIQKEYYNYILSLHPKRIIFNPGAENDELSELAQQHDIQPQEACTLVLLSTKQY